MTSPSTLLSPATPSPGDAALVPTTTVVGVGLTADVAFNPSEDEDEEEEEPGLAEEAPTAPVASVTVQLAVVVVLHDGEGGTSSPVVVIVVVVSAQLEVAATATSAPLLPVVASGACCAAHDRPTALARAAVIRLVAERMARRGRSQKRKSGFLPFWFLCKACRSQIKGLGSEQV